jgi:3-hydroxyacyl-[acyl-carrier-protein] dehydratase
MHSLNAKAGDKIVYFMGIDKARFRHPVMPGDMLLLPVKMQKARMPVWRFAGEAYVNGKLCAEAEFTAMIAEPREKADN